MANHPIAIRIHLLVCNFNLIHLTVVEILYFSLDQRGGPTDRQTNTAIPRTTPLGWLKTTCTITYTILKISTLYTVTLLQM